MRLVRPALWCTVASLLAACRFEVAGETDGGDDGSTTTASEATSSSVSTDDSSSSGGVTTSDDSMATASESTTSGSTTSDASSTTSTDACDPAPLFTEVVTLDDAALGAGMMTSNHDFGEYAYSEVMDIGLVTFPFEVPCNDTYYLWALVWDQDTSPFNDGGNADAFAASVDVGSEFNWSYGCQTLFQVSQWSYERVQIAEPLDCSTETPQVFALAPGIHELTLRNLEAGSFDGDTPGDVAAVARVFVTNDPQFVPDPDTE